ncbi:hypothetical protein ACFOU2_21175 [Bacillus songklensis]|uniref:Uncharacterized protein n=1 Tax=Bacillus songklensis TaxID=1069116 RepID=A0ABV8B8M5_9BACI
MFGSLKAKRDDKEISQKKTNIINFEKKRREKRRFFFLKSYQFFGKSQEFTDWIEWQRRNK